MTDRELMRQALEALDAYSWEQVQSATVALRERLAQPELECDGKCCVRVPRREWVGLTDREIEEIARYQDEHGSGPWHLAFARAIEAKLKEKNA